MVWVDAAAPAPQSPTSRPRQAAQLSNQGGVDQGPGTSPVGRLNQPPLDDGLNVKLETLGHGVEENRLVLRNCAKMQGRLDFYT